jgi:DNA-binding NarL/FixJ family response regulator
MNRVLIVEDVAETRRWLEDIAAAAFPGCKMVGAASVREAFQAAETEGFDVALIDLGLPDGSGIDVVRRLKKHCPKCVCVVTTVMADDAHIVASLSAGAEGYLLKEQPNDVLKRQLSQLAAGIPALSPSIARRIIEHFRYTGPAADPDGELTEREREVLALIGRGLRNLDVANALNLAESTVASHIKRIYGKLGISSRAEASWHATRMGLARSQNNKS